MWTMEQNWSQIRILLCPNWQRLHHQGYSSAFEIAHFAHMTNDHQCLDPRDFSSPWIYWMGTRATLDWEIVISKMAKSRFVSVSDHVLARILQAPSSPIFVTCTSLECQTLRSQLLAAIVRQVFAVRLQCISPFVLLDLCTYTYSREGTFAQSCVH